MKKDFEIFSVVAPVYNEEEVLEEFCRRTSAVLSGYAKHWEILLVNDGSTDHTPEILRTLHQDNPNIKYISFSRNFGHSSALSAGLVYAKGSVVALIDSDLQDPPEVLPKFFDKLREGYDVVYGIRTKRKENALKRGAYWAFYRLFKSVAQIKNVALDSGDFAVLDRKVVTALRDLPERSRFMRGLRSWVGYRQYGLPYERATRFSGTSKYTFKKLLHLALEGFFSFSFIPLRFASFIGFFAAFVSFLCILIVLYLRITYGVIGIPGFSSTMIGILFIGGVQLISLGILGEYIGRIYDEVRHRPLYLITETGGLSKEDTHGH